MSYFRDVSHLAHAFYSSSCPVSADRSVVRASALACHYTLQMQHIATFCNVLEVVFRFIPWSLDMTASPHLVSWESPKRMDGAIYGGLCEARRATAGAETSRLSLLAGIGFSKCQMQIFRDPCSQVLLRSVCILFRSAKISGD